MLKFDLKKYTIKHGKYSKEATITLLVNLMNDVDELQDIVRYGLNPAKYTPGMTTTKKEDLQNILLTDALFRIGLDDEDCRETLAVNGKECQLPLHNFNDVQFGKVNVKLEGKGTDADPQIPILTLEFTVNCSSELNDWLYGNLEKTIGLWLKMIEDTQGTIAGLVVDENTGEVINKQTGEVMS